MQRDWMLRPGMLDGPVPPEVLARVRDFSPLIDAGEQVERVAIATAPLTLLVMTDRYLHMVTARGTHQWAEGEPRSSLAHEPTGRNFSWSSARLARSVGSAGCCRQALPSVLPASCTSRSPSRTSGALRGRCRRSPTPFGRRSFYC